MANYNQRYITYEQFMVLQQIGLSYEGFVRGLGYTYPQAFAIPPIHHQPHSQVQHVPDGNSFYSRGLMQMVDSSDEMRMRSYNIKPEDIMQQVVQPDGAGNVEINLGKGKFMTAPADNYKVDVRISDGADGQMLFIKATNVATGEQMSSMPSLLREFKKDYWELSKQPNQLKKFGKAALEINNTYSQCSVEDGDWFSDVWNSAVARFLISDSYSIGLSANAAAYVGCGTTPINITLLTRGEMGIFLTPTVNTSGGDGVEANAVVSMSRGWFTGDPRKIQSSYLQGHSFGGSIGLGLGLNGGLGAMFAPADINKPFGDGFVIIGSQIGVGIEGSPSTLLNIQANYQYTPEIKTIYK